MRYKPALAVLALSAVWVCVGMAQKSDANANRMQSSDTTFVTKAAQGGMAEVELGQLAATRATNDKVKQFGQKMVDDHTKVNNELKTLASGKGVTLPTSSDPKSEATKKKLSAMNGAAFDRAYMQDMVSDHQKDVSEFQKEADHGTDPEVKAFAQKNLPTLQQHLQMAQDALASAKSEPSK